ncbi:MAG: hypothetical protein ACRD2C_12935 [Acidimicrobiales bacterium]
MRGLARTTVATAARLGGSPRTLAGTDWRIARRYGAPIHDTSLGEPPELSPSLGSHLPAEAIDRAGADLILYGHTHRGTERGRTPGDIRVRNVAQPVPRSAYRAFDLAAANDEPGRSRARQVSRGR